MLLQEVTTEWQRALAERFAQQYPVQVFRIHSRAAGGLAVLSKLPIKAEEMLPRPSAAGSRRSGCRSTRRSVRSRS